MDGELPQQVMQLWPVLSNLVPCRVVDGCAHSMHAAFQACCLGGLGGCKGKPGTCHGRPAALAFTPDDQWLEKAACGEAAVV